MDPLRHWMAYASFLTAVGGGLLLAAAAWTLLRLV
jgi:hypothetical protein